MKNVRVFLIFALLLALCVLPVAAEVVGASAEYYEPYYEAQRQQREAQRRIFLIVQYALLCVFPSLVGVIFSILRMVRAKKDKRLWGVLLLLIAAFFASYTLFFIYIF